MKSIALALLLCSLAAAKDWVVEVDGAPEIFAVGDAHSDYVRLAAAMRAAGLIDKNDKWIAGPALLVTTGDMIDKGPRALDVLRLLKRLREEGHAVVLAGNHEAEFLADPGASKVKEFANQLRAAGVNPVDVGDCKGEFGEFLCSLPLAARVNDIFFSHAGNSGGRTMPQIAFDVEKDFGKHGYSARQIIGDGSVIEARLNGTGPGREPWIDAGLPSRSEKQLLTEYAKTLGVAHIVEGHVPSEVRFTDGVVRHAGEMFQRFGLLFLIDTGMSEGVDDSMGAVLHFTKDRATAICPDGKKTLLWDAVTKQDSGRAAACGK